MKDDEYLPVKPNINNYNRLDGKATIKQRVSPNLDSNVKEYISNKKTDALKLDSPLTREEVEANENNKYAEADKNKGTSWVLIILAVIVIILICIIIYYVINYNKLTVGAIIPDSIVKPSMINHYNGNPAVNIENPTTHSLEPKKPGNFVEPSKEDLDNAYSKLASIKEEPDEESAEENISSIEVDELDKEVGDNLDENNEIDIQMDHISKIVELDDSDNDTDIMDKFISQANE